MGNLGAVRVLCTCELRVSRCKGFLGLESWGLKGVQSVGVLGLGNRGFKPKVAELTTDIEARKRLRESPHSCTVQSMFQ